MDRAETIKLLFRIREALADAFGDRLRGVVLFGSQARGEALPDSDIDLLVLLEGPVCLGEDIKRAIEAVYGMVLELGRPIHPLPVDVLEYEAQEFPLYRNAKREGIAA
jgi:predicted nucleotidyltransferase